MSAYDDSPVKLAKAIEEGETVLIPNFYRGRLMGWERVIVVGVQKNRKTITLHTAEGERLRLGLTRVVRVELE